MKVDLHCHSLVSDGVLDPAEVVRRAAANGVALLSLTDHDETAGCAAAEAEARAWGISFVPGVEISVSFADETIHVVGLGVDPDDAALSEGLQRVRSGRDARARRIAEELERHGIHGAWEGAMRLAKNPALVSRAHFARHIVSLGLMRSVSEVFQYYLAKGKPGYVAHEWAVLEEAISWIRGAGGVAVLAHPARYRLSAAQFEELLRRFDEAGGAAVEVSSGSHGPDDMRRWAHVARHWGFAASIGSDFHAPAESPVDLGAAHPLPPDLTPVWQLLECAL
ncbi:3',5'-nucleoside bisphosphate phosphatase [Tepidiphilus thermophilus]|jgi:predicted metal-dependent phosphoesterase TrpH|uniref:Predicted metal-dependent phosphoesterase TrpH, contains PHP domain n=1 Tax=Tepidiphilus thermophilus TaxID=876478 RepID=A0A0K6IR67_9PROT|nr:3',5'-nucleoside bisphosphate phosphatase [Tepidiphilus thermophilus]MDK2797081.1 3,5-nucleoside bisphosphate phosphatase [Tepidiphilus sp.]CUB05574.1 Predicted metal-dependent phosphoesterase TrpH, contains PHP domain [Tepidiphilus thermophilus]